MFEWLPRRQNDYSKTTKVALPGARLEMIMMGSVYLEGGVFPDSGKNSAIPASVMSKGESYLLRRASYFNDIWHEKIISNNLRRALVDNIATLYVDRGVALPELIKEGNLGLARALENFELEGGARFSTYATRCIRQNIEHAIMSHAETLHSSAPAGAVPAV